MGRLLTGRALTGRFLGDTFKYRKAYGKAGPLREALYEEGRSLQEGPVPYAKGRGPLRVLHREGRRRGLREGRALTGEEFTGRAGSFLHREGRQDVPPLRGLLRVPLQERRSYATGLRADRLTGSLTRRLRGATLPELGWNFRLCADQKNSFFPRVGPFLDLLPSEGPSPYRGPYGQTAYGKAPYGEASYGKAPDGEASYGKEVSWRHLSVQESSREGWALTGNPLRGGTVLTGRAGPLREGPGSLGPSQRRTTKRLTGRQGPYGKPLTGRNGPYGKARSLQEGPGASFIEKDDETYRLYGAFYGCPYGNDVPTLRGPLRADRLTGSLTGRNGPYGKGRSYPEIPKDLESRNSP